MRKYWKILSTVTLAALVMSACGSSNDKVDNQAGGSDQTGYETPNENELAVEEMIKTSIQYHDGAYHFELVNTSDETVDLTFSSSQEYEYTITDSQGNHLYTYSMDKMFGLMVVEKSLEPNEGYVVEVDVEFLETVESDTYTLEIWSMALESDQLRDKIEITIENDRNAGKYVGQIDNNSVEIIGDDGEAKAYRLTDDVREVIDVLEKDQPVSYHFHEENGQLILTMIEAK